MTAERQFLGADHLTETQEKILTLAKQGMTPSDMLPYFPTFQSESLKKICRHLRKRGYEIPNGIATAHKNGFDKSESFDPRRATLEHLLDLKRAGHTTFLYRLRCEYRMKPGRGDRALAPPLDFSGCGSPAAMCVAS
jgi:hypothetical protein